MVGYSVYLGVNHEGRKQRRFFKHLSEAETFQRTQDANPEPVGHLLERKTELLYCLERLKSARVSLVEVVGRFGYAVWHTSKWTR